MSNFGHFRALETPGGDFVDFPEHHCGVLEAPQDAHWETLGPHCTMAKRGHISKACFLCDVSVKSGHLFEVTVRVESSFVSHVAHWNQKYQMGWCGCEVVRADWFVASRALISAPPPV